MLNYFVRNLTYFQTVRNNRDLNTGYIYDNEFAKLQKYINDKILPTIDNLKNNRIHGPLDSDGYLLRNIGNRITKFDRVRASDIPDNLITFDKLSKITSSSIVYCGSGNLISIPCVNADTTLVNNIDNCSFEKIKANNILNGSITSTKVALKTLNLKHIAVGALNPFLNINIPTVKILDNAINDVKLADRSVTKAKLNETTINLRDNSHLTLVRQNVTHLVNDAHMVKINHIADNSVDFNLMFRNNRVLRNNCLPLSMLRAKNNADISPYKIFYNNPITNAYIKDGSFAPIIAQNVNQRIHKSKLCDLIKQKLIAGGLVV